MKRAKKRLPKRIRLFGFFLSRLLRCLLAAAVLDGVLLYRDYQSETHNYSFGSDEWMSKIGHITTVNYGGDKPFGEALLESGGVPNLLQYLTRHEYPFLTGCVPLPASDISVMLIQTDTGELTISEPSVQLYTFTNRASENNSYRNDRIESDTQLYKASPEESEQIADNILAYTKKHILRFEWNYHAAHKGIAFRYTEPTVLRAAVKDDRFTILDFGWRDSDPMHGITVKNLVCRDEIIPDGWRILAKNGFNKQNGSYVYDVSNDPNDTVSAGEETIYYLAISGYPAKCKAGELMQLTADVVTGSIQAKLDRCEELKAIIADNSGKLREEYYSQIYAKEIEKRKRIEEAEKRGTPNFFTPTDEMPTPEEKLKEYAKEIGYIPEQYAREITDNDHMKPENKWTRYYMQTSPVTLNGTNYCLFCLMTSDLRLALYPDFVFRSIQCLIGALLLTILWTVLVYPKTRRTYEMDEYRRNLTAALAHDLKSPLTAISGYAENLNSSVHPEKQAHYFASILENTQYMDRIITNVLALSKLEQNTKAKKQRIELVQMLREINANRQVEIESRNLNVEITGSCSVKADPMMMIQALRNLLDNAVKFTPDGGYISVTGEGRYLRIVNDIAEDKVDRVETLCEAFVKGDSSRSNQNGTGLGLSVVRQIAELNKLHLSLESSDHKFTVLLRR